MANPAFVILACVAGLRGGGGGGDWEEEGRAPLRAVRQAIIIQEQS